MLPAILVDAAFAPGGRGHNKDNEYFSVEGDFRQASASIEGVPQCTQPSSGIGKFASALRDFD